MQYGLRILAAAFVCIDLLTPAAHAQQDDWPKELDPRESVPNGEVHGDVPDWVFGKPRIPPFSLKDHFAVGTQARACANTLSRAALAQDLWNAGASAAHFDNCAFEEGLSYIRDRQKAAAVHFATAQQLVSASGQVNDAVTVSVASGMFRLGQALHAVQDFYSHSDYVELLERSGVDIDGAKPLSFFDGASDETIRRLVSDQALVSGTWWIGRPKRCSAGAQAHHDLAKDHADSGKGSVVTRWGKTHHFMALRLARQSTERFLDDAVKSWPVLEKVCGELIGTNQPFDPRKEEKGN